MITITDSIPIGGPATGGIVWVLRGTRRLPDQPSRFELKRNLRRLRQPCCARTGRGSAEHLPPMRPLTAAEAARIAADIKLLKQLLKSAPPEPSAAELLAAYQAEAAAYDGPGCYDCRGQGYCSRCGGAS